VGIGGDVGAGSVVVSGTVHGCVVVGEAKPVQVDRRAVAETLQAMKPLSADQHLSVVAWMEREFGTQIVKGLSADSHRRVRRYVEAVLSGTKAPPPLPQKTAPEAMPPEVQRLMDEARKSSERRQALFGTKRHANWTGGKR
jgi:hypothetical protein